MTETMLMPEVPTSDRTIASRVLLDTAYALTAFVMAIPSFGCRRRTPTRGLRAALAVRRQWPEARLLVLSQYVEVSYADDLLATGDASAR
jgi:hypothetical protein